MRISQMYLLGSARSIVAEIMMQKKRRKAREVT